MYVYLRTKFQVSRIILMSFRQGDNLTTPPSPRPQNEPLKGQPWLGLRYVFNNAEKYSPSIFVSIFCDYAVARYRKLATRKTEVNLILTREENIWKISYLQ